VRCLDVLPFNHACCMRCALPLAHADAHCGRCLRRAPPFARTLAPLRYDYPIDRLIAAFKFQGNLAAGKALCAPLRDSVLRAATASHLLLPVPLHRTRLAARGFNQAWEIARHLAHAFDWPARADVLTRTRPTLAQAGLDARARRHNVRDAFAVAISLRGQHVALVDDVITTGATVRECARVLRAAGAASVCVLALARAAGPNVGAGA
jgi:ComF family protein